MTAFSLAIVTGASLMAYEDLSHRTLTERALVVAHQNASDLPSDFGPEGKFGKEIIAGAGRHDGLWWCEWLGADTDGEDCTKYRIEGDCKVRVRRMGGRRGVTEPFSQSGSDTLTLKT